MTNQHTTVRASTQNGELTVSRHSTDSPILPIAQIEQLHSFRPDKVDWVFEQTQKEAEHRRSQDSRINIFILIERLTGQIFGLVVALAGLGSSAYMATHGAQTTGSIIGGTTLVAMVTAFVVGRTKPGKPKPENAEPPASSKHKKK